jgi:hypothetical protein
MIAAVVYLLGALTTFLCAVLLLRGYGRTHHKLLLWSGLCFVGLTVSNGLLFVDLVLIPQMSLHRLRLGSAAVSMLLLLYALVWESEGS